MFIQSKITRRFQTIILISMFALTSVLITDNVFARDRGERGGTSYRTEQRGEGSSVRQRREREDNSYRTERRSGYSSVRERRDRVVIRTPRLTRHGHVVHRLPSGYRRVWYDREPFYYYRGVFYRPALSGFVVVAAPSGIIVASLPIGYQRIWVNDIRYYVYGGVFYREAPSGYVVVDAPPHVVVEEDIPVLVQPTETAEGTVSVIASILNIRSGPGLHYPVIYQIHKGYILEIHDKTIEWLYVQLPNGEFGWVMNIYTNPLEPPGSG